MPSTLYVWSCNEGGAQALEADPVGAVRPICTGGQGSYVQVNVADLMPTASVDWDQVVWASSVTVVMWATGIGVGLLLNTIKRGRI